MFNKYKEIQVFIHDWFNKLWFNKPMTTTKKEEYPFVVRNKVILLKHTISYEEKFVGKVGEVVAVHTSSVGFAPFYTVRFVTVSWCSVNDMHHGVFTRDQLEKYEPPFELFI